MRLTIFIILFISAYSAKGQTDSLLIGKVTYLTSEHVYVRFPSTELILIGDSLSFQKSNVEDNIKCLVVVNKSSTSCICSIVNNCPVALNEIIVFSVPEMDVSSPVEMDMISDVTVADPKPIELKPQVEPEVVSAQRIRGRISAGTYSNLSPDDDRHRLLMRLSLNAANINDSKISLESYLTYRQNFIQNNKADTETKFFRVYNLALTYDVDSTTQIVFGRKTNRKISSVGAIDGLQINKYFGKFYTGGIAGFRPDVRAFDFNSKLFEYGAYIGMATRRKNNSSETTLGFLQQNNAGSVDRRYAYVQHRSWLGRKLSLFGSMEVDLVGALDTLKNADPRVTSLYISTRYRFSRKVSASFSYDTRKRIIYYETFRNEVERLLDDDEARQGLRASINFRLLKYVSLGVSGSKRYQTSEANQSNNLNTYISHSKLPGIGGSLSLRFNINQSNYLQSQIYSFRYSRQLIQRVLHGQLYARHVNYDYANIEQKKSQQYYGLSFSFRLKRGFRFSMMGEMAVRTSETNYRFNTKLIKRFNSKSKSK